MEGRYQYFRPGQDLQTPRIDRILLPNSRLKEAGWTLGPIGVELKRSGTKLGPPFCQLVSYSHATFKIGNTWIVPEWYFLWPAERLTGPLQSILAGQRCGGAYRNQYGQLVFHSAFVLAKVGPDFESAIDVRPDNADHGRKVGSR